MSFTVARERFKPVELPEANTASKIQQGSLVEGFAEGYGAVFCRVVVVDVQITLAREFEVQVSVLGHRVQHVVEESEAGFDLVFFLPYELVKMSTLGGRNERNGAGCERTVFEKCPFEEQMQMQ